VMNDERVMLAYAWDGLPLATQHGFPLRIYIPNHYGMKQPKWITRIEAIDHPGEGYWVERGWVTFDNPNRIDPVIDLTAKTEVRNYEIALDLSGTIGSLEPGCEADLVVIDPAATPLLKLRSERCRSIEELLFVLMTLGDDRAIRATYVAGVTTSSPQ